MKNMNYKNNQNNSIQNLKKDNDNDFLKIERTRSHSFGKSSSNIQNKKKDDRMNNNFYNSLKEDSSNASNSSNSISSLEDNENEFKGFMNDNELKKDDINIMVNKNENQKNYDFGFVPKKKPYQTSQCEKINDIEYKNDINEQNIRKEIHENEDNKNNLNNQLNQTNYYHVKSNFMKEEENKIEDIEENQEERDEKDENKTYYKNKSNLYCINCGKRGHTTKKCNFPIISIGIICIYIQNFQIDINTILNYSKKMQNKYLFENEELDMLINIYEKIKNYNKEQLDHVIKYVMICRKNSLSYVDFMRGKYDIDDYEYLHNTIYMMTEKEKKDLINNKFEDLWVDLWSNSYNINYSQEYEESKSKFDKLKKGYMIQKNEILFNIDFKSIIDTSIQKYKEPEWGFPKGRRNFNEKNIDCAKREFEEETGLKESDYHIINISPLEELYLGSNHIRYKHIYYFGQIQSYVNIEVDKTNVHQKIEIGDIQYMTFEDGYDKIRAYHIEKKNILQNIHIFLINLILNYKKIFKTYYEDNKILFNKEMKI